MLAVVVPHQEGGDDAGCGPVRHPSMSPAGPVDLTCSQSINPRGGRCQGRQEYSRA